MKEKQKEAEAVTWRVDFDGILQPAVRASLIEELIKFIIFERRQIPTVFDILKRPELSDDVTGPGGKKKSVHDRKLDSCIEGIDVILNTVREALTKHNAVHEVLLILGPTLVSPKEVYLLKLPDTSYKGDLLNRKKCVQTMMRKLISKDIFKGLKDIHTSNIHVLLKCPTEMKVDNLQPKINFEVPKRGQRFDLEIGCTCERMGSGTESESSLDETHPLLRMLAECDISGVGLLDVSGEAAGGASVMAAEAKGEDDVTGSVANARGRDDDKMIWYRVNVAVKGCLGKAADCAGMGWC